MKRVLVEQPDAVTSQKQLASMLVVHHRKWLNSHPCCIYFNGFIISMTYTLSVFHLQHMLPSCESLHCWSGLWACHQILQGSIILHGKRWKGTICPSCSAFHPPSASFTCMGPIDLLSIMSLGKRQGSMTFFLTFHPNIITRKICKFACYYQASSLVILFCSEV